MKTIFIVFILAIGLGISQAQWGTGVFVNEVELSQADLVTLAYYQIYLPIGYYWFDPALGFIPYDGTGTIPDQPVYDSAYSDYGSVAIDDDFTGFISPDGSVTCGPDGGCIFSH